MAKQDDLSITANGQIVSGWQEIRLTRGVERFPSDFDIVATEKYPGSMSVVFQPGMRCEVKIGSTLVLTGYIDRVTPSFNAHQHTIRISGRSKCQDLMDCSADIQAFGGQINGATFVSLAQQLCKPFGIQVTDLTAQVGVEPIKFETFSVNLGETPYEILERVARSVGVLLYDDVDGNLVISRIGKHAGEVRGVTEGINIQSAGAAFCMDQRYSHYIVVPTTVDTTGDVRQSLNSGAGFAVATSRDVGTPRYRPMIIVGEQFQNGQSLSQARADWENNRRWGRSQAARVTVDSWRDVDGRLWQPNTLVAMDIPTLYLSKKKWVLSEVTYSRGMTTGTTADMVLMPPEAFSIQPTTLSPYDWDRTQALQQGSQQ
ncbi:phage baseplate assembly protein [Paracraurococcus lichenis]|uniref:Phage tail protein n=1 Tax=Paracraurococcus lichenis TaxID=3064888 RepID=A0ABT9E4H0_9PROT|nr:hypothetical protein [Paracraurococcus sp. LOR1-02]MDO9711046.1 hypothetical protein [Paracraurococcus sp. LOR1-02]